MPFCTQCGRQVTDRDLYCGSCGAPQREAAASSGASPGAGRCAADPFAQVSDRTASVLCYLPLVGWIPAIFVLASSRFRHDRDTRFHAFQGLYLFVAWLIVDWVVHPMTRASGGMFFPIDGLLKAALIGAWIWMLVKVSQHQTFKLPLIGDIAEKSAAEQR